MVQGLLYSQGLHIDIQGLHMDSQRLHMVQGLLYSQGLHIDSQSLHMVQGLLDSQGLDRPGLLDRQGLDRPDLRIHSQGLRMDSHRLNKWDFPNLKILVKILVHHCEDHHLGTHNSYASEYDHTLTPWSSWSSWSFWSIHLCEDHHLCTHNFYASENDHTLTPWSSWSLQYCENRHLRTHNSYASENDRTLTPWPSWSSLISSLLPCFFACPLEYGHHLQSSRSQSGNDYGRNVWLISFS